MHRTAAFLDLKPEQCMMVAAHNADLVAATRPRLPHRLSSTGRPNTGRTRHATSRPSTISTVIADSFVDLADKLGC